MNGRRVATAVSDTSALTAWEWVGLGATYNLADAHPQGVPNRDYELLADSFHHVFAAARQSRQADLEAEFIDQFASFTGQRGLAQSHISLHYSSSIAIDVVAKMLNQSQFLRVGLVCPTFDNLPAILHRAGLALVAIGEEAITSGAPPEVFDTVDALFVVTPNNPSGLTLDQTAFSRLAETCAEHRLPLIVDTSFRLFEPRALDWDMYDVLSRAAVQFCVIEDTGKAFALGELKLGILATSVSLAPVIEAITDELLLNVSPVTLVALTRALRIEIARVRSGKKFSAREVVAVNRKTLRLSLEKIDMRPVYSDSNISVEFIDLGIGQDGAAVAADFANSGVAVLPGAQFFWANPLRGRSMIRVSLFRSESYFAAAISRLEKLLQGVHL